MARRKRRIDKVILFERGYSIAQVAKLTRSTRSMVESAMRTEYACKDHVETIETIDETILEMISIMETAGLGKDVTKRLRTMLKEEPRKYMRDYVKLLRIAIQDENNPN